MASIIKRGATWRAQVARGGQRHTATFDTQGEAVAWAEAVEEKIVRGQTVERAVVPSANIADLFDRYAREVSPQKKGGRWEDIRLRALSRSDIFGVGVSQFDATHLARWRDQRLVRVSALTVNRELNLISAVLTHAQREWRAQIRDNPVRGIRRPRNPPARTRRISDDERQAILRQLEWDGESHPGSRRQWVAFAFLLALETAMRKGEVLGLAWSDVDLRNRRVRLRTTKNGEARDVPLSHAAMRLINLLRPTTDMLVPVASGTFDMLFRRAKMAAGLHDLRFHDSRREAATTMSKKLSNILELAAVTGHKSLKCLQIYYRPDAADLARKLD